MTEQGLLYIHASYSPTEILFTHTRTHTHTHTHAFCTTHTSDSVSMRSYWCSVAEIIKEANYRVTKAREGHKKRDWSHLISAGMAFRRAPLAGTAGMRMRECRPELPSDVSSRRPRRLSPVPRIFPIPYFLRIWVYCGPRKRKEK